MARPNSHADAQIAAIAQVNSAQMATRNVDDVANLNLNIINPGITVTADHWAFHKGS